MEKNGLELCFVTGNKEKLAVAKLALKGQPIKIISTKIDCEEIQSESVEEIAIKSAIFAMKKIHKPLVKIDAGLFIGALDGFPGPYSAFVEKKLKARNILQMMKGVSNRKAFYQEVLVFLEAGKEPVVFVTFTYGHIARRSSGKFGWNFDRIFIANGDKKTMANFNDQERIAKYSNKHWQELVLFLRSNRYL